MNVNGQAYRSIWRDTDGQSVAIIDQTLLPHEFSVKKLHSVSDCAEAITSMRVRGAPLIGATAAYGMALAMQSDSSDSNLSASRDVLMSTRPTAVNLRWALDRVMAKLVDRPKNERLAASFDLADRLCEEDIETNRRIGENGLALIRDLYEGRGDTGSAFHILTHCNAGWLATVDWGTALAPIYMAHDEGIPVHVWVDETRPRNQGAALTAWELSAHGVPHDLIVDNAGGHLMQHGQVDLCITGTDRTTASGDVCNKVGTYLKALAAADNGIPFYVALPGPTIDWQLEDGVAGIPIEERSADEVIYVHGKLDSGQQGRVRITPGNVSARNYAFDVTPARLVTGLITERGVCAASRDGLASLYPDREGRV